MDFSFKEIQPWSTSDIPVPSWKQNSKYCSFSCDDIGSLKNLNKPIPQLYENCITYQIVYFALLYTDGMDSCWWMINIDSQKLPTLFKIFQCNYRSLSPIAQVRMSELIQEKGKRPCRNLFQFWGCWNEYCAVHVKALCKHTAAEWTLMKLKIHIQHSWHRQVSITPSLTE